MIPNSPNNPTCPSPILLTVPSRKLLGEGWKMKKVAWRNIFSINLHRSSKQHSLPVYQDGCVAAHCCSSLLHFSWAWHSHTLEGHLRPWEFDNDEMFPLAYSSLPWVVLMQVAVQTICYPLVHFVSIALVQGQLDYLLDRGNSTAAKLAQLSQYRQPKHTYSEDAETIDISNLNSGINHTQMTTCMTIHSKSVSWVPGQCWLSHSAWTSWFLSR